MTTDALSGRVRLRLLLLRRRSRRCRTGRLSDEEARPFPGHFWNGRRNQSLHEALMQRLVALSTDLKWREMMPAHQSAHLSHPRAGNKEGPQQVAVSLCVKSIQIHHDPPFSTCLDHEVISTVDGEATHLTQLRRTYDRFF